jgi:hypothetical protein
MQLEPIDTCAAFSAPQRLTTPDAVFRDEFNPHVDR